MRKSSTGWRRLVCEDTDCAMSSCHHDESDVSEKDFWQAHPPLTRILRTAKRRLGASVPLVTQEKDVGAVGDGSRLGDQGLGNLSLPGLVDAAYQEFVFQLAEVAVSREVFRSAVGGLERIAGLHPAPG